MTLLIALEFDQPQTTSFSAWLIGLALEQVDAEVTHSKQTRGHVRHADHPVPDTQPADTLAAIGDEILNTGLCRPCIDHREPPGRAHRTSLTVT